MAKMRERSFQAEYTSFSQDTTGHTETAFDSSRIPSPDAPIVPLSSSPGVANNRSSPVLVGSSLDAIGYESSVSRTDSLSSGSTTTVRQDEDLARHELKRELALHRMEFSNLLTERLLNVSDYTGEVINRRVLWRLDSSAGASSSSPEAHVQGYRIIKRTHSGSALEELPYTPNKYRRLEQSGRTPARQVSRVPTAPSSPLVTHSWHGSVPIVAPPAFYIPRLPLSADTEAKIRLGKFLQREGNERARDGIARTPMDIEGGLGCVARKIATVIPVSKSQWENAFGLDRSLRERVIAWMTSVLPKHPSGAPCTRTSVSVGSEAPSRESSIASTSSVSSRLSNLYDQLSSCPETRFHAVWMFLRYFFLVSAEADYSEMNSHSVKSHSPSADQFGPPDELIVWDVALACLALSVKFHRDFLEPLHPVQADEFLELAHHDVNYEELETGQRDVLSAFSYSVGVSPQPLLDELWRALPSLRELLHFEGGWNALQKEVWLRLYDVIYAPDMMKFPQSCLVMTALIDALPPFLAARYEYDAPWHCKTIRKQGCPASNHVQERKARFWKRASDNCEGVIEDIKAVVGVTDVQLSGCREWWATST